MTPAPLLILIVDDEAPLANLLKQYLERLGHRAEVCTQASTALALLKANLNYSVLVADLAMPEMSGEELIAQAQAFNPKLRAVLTSGYAHRARQPGVVFLQKPFAPKILAEEIAKMLAD